MKRRLLQAVLVLAVALVTVSVAACESELPGGAVAQVGDVYISADELEEQVTEEASAYGLTGADEATLSSLRQYVLENLILNVIAEIEADKLGLTVTDEEVQAEVDTAIAYYFSGDPEAFETALAENGTSLDDYKQVTREGLLRAKVQSEAIKDVTSVSDEEVVAYYEENESSYYVEPSREIRHILIKPAADDSDTTSGTAPEVTEADWQEALSAAQQVRQRLVGGGSWTEIAAKYSDDFATKDSGGDLGTVYLGQTVKEFEDEAFALGLDTISQPVKTVYGYHIIQVTAITTGGTQPLEKVRDQIESTLLDQAQQKAWQDWIETKKADIGVVYRSDLQPATTTTESTTTTNSAETDSTALSETTTTVEP